MGMFDTVMVKDEAFPELEGRPLQTKDLENCLLEYSIENDQLMEDGVLVEFSGNLNMYDFDTDTSRWEEWQAKVINGIVTEIVQTKCRTIPRVRL